MTFVEMQHTNNNYHIEMLYEFGLFYVRVCPMNDSLCSYPIAQTFYTKDEKKKAIATFKRYVKKYS